ncbi:MAG: transcription termination factor NusA [Erysipelotrichaceae bacterium]
MKLKDFMEALQAIESDRMLSKEIVVEALQEALAKAFRKHIEIPDALVKVDINDKTGEIKVYQQRLVVEEVEDDELEISLEDALKIKASYKLEDLVDEEVSIANLGRAAVILAKNVMKQKIREAEKQVVFDEYSDKLEDMVIGTVESVEDKFTIVNLGKTLALMPRGAAMPNEKYYDGQRLRVVITEVNRETKGAQVLVSRADANLVKRLFEKEVPEIFNGIVEIKAIARDAGERTKMAVYSKNENIDPRGACIGPRGARVQVVIDELGGEKIDIFEWSDDATLLIKNALAPAEILAVIPNNERKGLLVIVNDSQLSLAIGKKGKNARLAVKLTGSKIDIKSESEVEALNIDWKSIAAKQKEEQAIKAAEAKANAQEEAFKEEADKSAAINDEFLDDLIPTQRVAVDYMAEQDAAKATQEAIAKEETEATEATEAVEFSEADEEMSEAKAEAKAAKAAAKAKPADTELEAAAKIAKEKVKVEGLNIKEKQEYVSKFEKIAGKTTTTTTKVEDKYAKSRFKRDEKPTEIRRTKAAPVDADYEFKPIYSAEELAEISKQEQMEKEKDWINDDIDFDEFDEYYEGTK